VEANSFSLNLLGGFSQLTGFKGRLFKLFLLVVILGIHYLGKNIFISSLFQRDYSLKFFNFGCRFHLGILRHSWELT